MTIETEMLLCIQVASQLRALNTTYTMYRLLVLLTCVATFAAIYASYPILFVMGLGLMLYLVGLTFREQNDIKITEAFLERLTRRLSQLYEHGTHPPHSKTHLADILSDAERTLKRVQ